MSDTAWALAEEQLMDGSREDQAFVLKQILPLLVKAAKDKDEESDVSKARDETVELFRQMGLSLGPRPCPHCGELV